MPENRNKHVDDDYNNNGDHKNEANCLVTNTQSINVPAMQFLLSH